MPVLDQMECLKLKLKDMEPGRHWIVDKDDIKGKACSPMLSVKPESAIKSS